MTSREGQGLVIGRWIDRWGYLGAVVAVLAMLLVGLKRSGIYAPGPLAAFAQYMWLVAGVGVGFGVARPINRLLQHRLRHWVVTGGTPGFKGRRYRFVARLAFMAGFLAAGGVLALALVAQDWGLWPWRT